MKVISADAVRSDNSGISINDVSLASVALSAEEKQVGRTGTRYLLISNLKYSDSRPSLTNQ